jgi:hypothetical protein
MKESLGNYLDWILEPSSQDKLASCGKHTQITLYSNNNVQLIRFYCHRWDCPNCSTKKRDAIRKEIMDVSPYWWKVDLNVRSYQAVQKQINRAGAKYIALGTGENTTVFVDKKLADSIEEILKQPSEFRQRRFKHSRDLFQRRKSLETDVHLKQRVMVNESVRKLMERFSSKGYSANISSGGYYIDLGEDAEAALKEVLSEIKSQVEYRTVHKKADQMSNEADE